MSEHNVDRRTALKVFAASPVIASFVLTQPEISEAQRKTAILLSSDAEFAPTFFTEAEWRTVRLLADLVVPRDERSGSATDVGVPEFMDFMMIDKPRSQKWMRDGLAWLDAETRKRYGKIFVACDTAQQTALLDDIAWPKHAPAELKDGVAFFHDFRNLTMTGFWTTRVGIDDLQYKGNTFVPHWDGCPQEALQHLGVSYDR